MTVEGWREQGDSDNYFMGCPDFNDRPGLMLIATAGNTLCAMHPRLTLRLLRAAVAETRRHGQVERVRGSSCARERRQNDKHDKSRMD